MLQTPTQGDVLSIPATYAIDLIQAHSVYACAAQYPRYRDVPYLAFRVAGSVMGALYKLEEVVEILHTSRTALRALPESYRDRVRAYIKAGTALWGTFTPGGGLTRFFILSTDDPIPLPHQPVLAPPTRSWCYLRHEDLLDPSQSMVYAATTVAKRR